jgi:hypothetical protein
MNDLSDNLSSVDVATIIAVANALRALAARSFSFAVAALS